MASGIIVSLPPRCHAPGIGLAAARTTKCLIASAAWLECTNEPTHAILPHLRASSLAQRRTRTHHPIATHTSKLTHPPTSSSHKGGKSGALLLGVYGRLASPPLPHIWKCGCSDLSSHPSRPIASTCGRLRSTGAHFKSCARVSVLHARPHALAYARTHARTARARAHQSVRATRTLHVPVLTRRPRAARMAPPQEARPHRHPPRPRGPRGLHRGVAKRGSRHEPPPICGAATKGSSRAPAFWREHLAPPAALPQRS